MPELVMTLIENAKDTIPYTLAIGIMATGFLFWVRKDLKPLLVRFCLAPGRSCGQGGAYRRRWMCGRLPILRSANFGPDYGLHWINSLDFEAPAGQQEKLAHGYAFESGVLYSRTDLAMKTNRLGSVAVAIDVVATDMRGKVRTLYGTSLVGAPWSCYTGTMLYVAMSRSINDSGRIGYGLNRENNPLDMISRAGSSRIWLSPTI